MEEELKCPICFSLAENPYESNCCGNIFCENCVCLLKRNEEYYKCPICRKNVTFRESSFAKRLLTNLVVKCIYKCGESLLFHKMKIHLKICPEREYNCKLDENCKFKAKKDEFLQHLILSHSSTILNVSENFSKVKEQLPDPEFPLKTVKKNEREELRENVNNILSEYNYNRDNFNYDANEFNYNHGISNIDRSFYRNYLFRRRLLNSETSKNHSEVENEDISVHSNKTVSDLHIMDRSIQRRNDNITTTHNTTNLFKYYLNDKKADNEHFNYIDNVYNKFDPTTADEEDYKNLYQQLVSQNKILKTEILDKIKKSDDLNTLTFNNNNEMLSNDNRKMEEEEKELEKNSIYKVSNKMNELIGKINKLDKGYKDFTEVSDKSKLPTDKTSSINTTMSLCLNNENK